MVRTRVSLLINEIFGNKNRSSSKILDLLRVSFIIILDEWLGLKKYFVDDSISSDTKCMLSYVYANPLLIHSLKLLHEIIGMSQKSENPVRVTEENHTFWLI